MPITLARNIGQHGEKFVTSLLGINSPQSIVWASEGPAYIGSIGLIIERLDLGLSDIVICEQINGVITKTKHIVYGADQIDAESPALAIKAKGLTDAAARAAVAAASSTYAGLKALGLAR
jgi:hypothetical protein